jgi:DNA replication protein
MISPNGSPEDPYREELRIREAENRRQSGILRMGGPEPFEKYTFENFNPDLNNTHRYLEAVKGFNTKTGNLFLLGPFGTGKTHLATAKAHQIFDMKGNVRVFTKKTFFEFVRKDSSWLEQIRELDLWVLDDIEDHPNYERVVTAIKLAIDERTNWKKHGIIFVSNKEIKDIGKILDGKIQDRLDGFFKNLVIPPDTPSARGLLKNASKTRG